MTMASGAASSSDQANSSPCSSRRRDRIPIATSEPHPRSGVGRWPTPRNLVQRTSAPGARDPSRLGPSALSRPGPHREHERVDFDRNGLALLDAAECKTLLGTPGIGRLALSVQALPVVLPVNFTLMPDGILVRTGAGSKFEQACDHAVVGFEIDGYDPMSHTGWSVLVQGHARILQSPAELAEAHRAGLTPWGNPA